MRQTFKRERVKFFMDKEEIVGFLKNKKYQWIAVFLILFIVLTMSSSIRLSNMSLLVDSTTGAHIPIALDPYYFLRVAETIVHNNGTLPAVDMMRSPSMNTSWPREILSRSIADIYYVTKLFNPNTTIQYVDVISPVIFYIIGLIIFFFLAYAISKNNGVAILSTTFLAFAPSYLYRTMAGFADHDSLGMVAVFSFFLVYTLALKNFEKNWKNTIIYSLLSGFMIAFVLATWGGAVTFILITMPFAFFLYWFFAKNDDIKTIAFYFLLIVSASLSSVIFGFPATDIVNRFTSSYGLLTPFVFVFILIDFGLSRIKNLKKIQLKKYRPLYSLGATTILGIVGLEVLHKSIFKIIMTIWAKLLNPFGNLGGGRLGATVAENSQPYLINWISQSGKVVFWLFVLGVFIVGIEFALKIKSKKHRSLFILSWMAAVSGVLFSRISSSSIFNGMNFISQSFYFLGILFFGVVLLITIIETKERINTNIIMFLSILFFVLIYGRSASRIFFLITPFVALSAAYATERLYHYYKNANDKTIKMIFLGFFVLAIIGSAYSVAVYHETVSVQAPHTGPSANVQWQKAMQWVRTNTSKRDIFVHWWDYGYWVQTLGDRPTVTDGGHSGGDQADHYIGRYVLTTPNPNSALSYMKTWNVSYLLIDQTDLGKYPAYSTIGGGAKNPSDREASIPVMPMNPKQTRETANGTMIAFNGGTYIFEDIIWKENGKTILLPAKKAAIIGIIVKLSNDRKMGQPEAVYLYNGVQTRIPIRYVYINGKIIDFKTGLDAIIDIIPSVTKTGIKRIGAAIYLSQKVSKSLFTQLFLLNDPFHEYTTIKLAHTEANPIIASIRGQGIAIGDFIYYHGFRGPIKIWKVEYPDGTKVFPDFKKPLDGVYAKFDKVFYGKQG